MGAGPIRIPPAMRSTVAVARLALAPRPGRTPPSSSYPGPDEPPSGMLKKALLRSAPALRFPAALGYRPEPSMARAFAGTSVHRTLVFIRLTHRSFILFPLRPGPFCILGSANGTFFALAFLLRSKARGSPSVANPLSGRKVHRTFLFIRLAPVPLLNSLPRGACPRGVRSIFSNICVFEK
ncbi:MAG: hypothetical protein BMS9Abin10_0474 [Gammaproteobacteria bacterium]|nr:MAG: hypothetical protein BMS9Abin10_0474 [Gammaproteobacteria bacterium]